MKTLLGLDIGSHSIKLIELKEDKGVLTLLSAGSMPTPKKNADHPIGTNLESIASTIQQLKKETGATGDDTVVALPESQVFTRIIEVPQMNQKELTSAIQWEAEQYVPLPLDQVNMDFTVLENAPSGGTGKMRILLVAAPKTLIDRYMNLLELADLTPIAAETEIIATSRSISRSIASLTNVMMVSIGAQTTDMAILRKNVLVFTRSVSAGGDALTRALSQNLEFTSPQSEEYKKTYGLQKDFLEGKLVTVLEPIMMTIVTEMKRAIAFFGERYQNEKIEAIIVSGGSAKLPGIVPFFTQALAIETQLANPWTGIVKEQRFSMLNTEGPLFAVAVGLAMRTS